MYSVMIAEDEMLVRLGLTVSVDWDRLGMKIVAEASNGTDAYDSFAKYRPDIVLTDIRMPGMNGVNLIQKIREIDRDCAIIIISCLSDFDTLRDVMQYNVSAYLIKATMTQASITEAVEKACRDLGRPLGKAESGEDQARRRALNCALNDYVISRSLNHAQFMQLLKRDDVKDPGPLAVLAAYFLDEHTPERMMLQPIQRMIDHSFGKSTSNLHLIHGSAMIFLISEKNIVDENAYAPILNEVHQYVLDNFQYQLRFIYCMEPVPMERLPAFLDAADGMRTHRYLFDQPMLLVDSCCRAAERDMLEWFEALRDCALCLRCNPSLYKDYLAAVESLKVSIGRSKSVVLQNLYTITVLMAQNNRQLTPAHLSRCHDYLSQATSFRSMMSIMDKQILSIAAPPTNAYTHLLASAIEHMARNLSGDLTLNSMASHVNISPGYFSTLLKQETGMRFSEFLSDLRLKKAQELLKDTTLSINEIAACCGFEDIAYFSRCFKSRLGMSPSHWRKQ